MNQHIDGISISPIQTEGQMNQLSPAWNAGFPMDKTISTGMVSGGIP